MLDSTIQKTLFISPTIPVLQVWLPAVPVLFCATCVAPGCNGKDMLHIDFGPLYGRGTGNNGPEIWTDANGFGFHSVTQRRPHILGLSCLGK